VDIAAWLRELGLERYNEAFQENEIDAEILPKLTSDDLKDIGITTVGHRRKLLEAIAALTGPAVAPQVEPSAPDEAVPRARPAEAERRQLTVLFCDLVGSTALAARLDPEEMRDLIRAYQNTVAGEIARFEGHVAKFMGDGVLAYFGWPRAHEDEAERAVRAGLAIAAAVPQLEGPEDATLAARVGIATGLVVVGDLIGHEEAREHAVVGETPNLAARLQAWAEPGAVVIADGTKRLLGGLFDCADLGAHDLKGFAEPVRAWQIVGAGAAESRFEALHKAGMSPLVGREHELGLLLDRWVLAKGGEGQVVLLSGEPGIGKSRITEALLERIATEPHVRLRYFCSPYHVNSALHPVIDQLERAARLKRDDPAEAQLDKLKATLREGTRTIDEAAALLAPLLSIPSSERNPLLSLGLQQQKSTTFEVLLDQLASLTKRQPVLQILEDAHWSDPTTIELFDLTVDPIQSLPVLLIITFRPGFTPPWTGYAHTTSLTLNRLGQRQVGMMIERLTGGKRLPTEVLAQILAKTDGVPLFVEELTKAVLESGLLRETDTAFVLDRPLPPLAIPASLHDSLMSRLDRMAPVKEIAQIGAAIGRTFSHGLLAAVAPLRNNELQDALSQLVSSELVFRRGTPPEATYTFKHALVQDAAYDTLLRSRRQQLHTRIAEALEERFPETVESEPELLARHYTEAGLAEPAIRYWLKAGQRATERSANVEAIAHLTSGLDLLEPDTAERLQQELRLQIALGAPLIAARGYAAPETGAAFDRARELCEQLGDTAQQLAALYGLWAYHTVRAEYGTARRLAEQFLCLAEAEASSALLVGHRLLGVTLFFLGELAEGHAQFGRALALYEPRRHRELAIRFGQNPRVSSLVYLAWSRWLLGYPDQAARAVEEAVAYARELNHANTLAYALAWGATVHQFRRETAEVQEHAGAALALSEEQGLSMWLAYATVLLGWTLAERDHPEGVARITRGLADLEATGAIFLRPHNLALLAESYAGCGQTEAGLRALGGALEAVERTGERWWEAEIHRLKGELVLAQSAGNPTEAEAGFRRAIDVALRQSAKSLELRAATSLARLWHDQGRRAAAHGLLAPVYGWFTEGFDTADLKDAKALLDELA
jgi:predicted ATPase/class 3 adenylate cyclase